MTRSLMPLAAALALGACWPAQSSAQAALRDRVEGGRDGVVQFSYAARADVCGSGAAFRIGTRTYLMSGSSFFTTEGEGGIPCRRGPVFVRVTKAEGQIITIAVEVGAATDREGVTDLGAVSAPVAAQYLLALAGRLEGRPGREALLPAMLADSARVTDGLLAIARNQALARQTRQSAVSWLGRELESLDPAEARSVSAALVTLARDGAEATPVRQSAVSVLARSARADLTALTAMAGGADLWLGKAAINALASSGDPRARAFLRTTLGRADLPDDVRVTVIRGLGREWATASDAELLRSSFATLTAATAKDAVISVMGDLGGTANVQWLLGVARDPDQTQALRHRATDAAARAGATSTELARLYDEASDRRGKEAAVNALVRVGDKRAMEKLMDIARRETDVTVRRSVIGRLSRSEDPEVKKLLLDLVVQP